jgi:hypothetical protein
LGRNEGNSGLAFQKLVYQPMVELIRYLEANGFTVHIFTADEALLAHWAHFENRVARY